MRVAITGGTGLIGSRLSARLRERGDDVTTLSLRHDDMAPKLEGRDAVVHLAGENLAQRWTAKAKREILESRETGGPFLCSVHAAEELPAEAVQLDDGVA